MHARKFLPAVYVLCFLLCGAVAASAQACGDQICQRPPDNTSCYTCAAGNGYNCTVSNCSSCTENTCPTDACSIDPFSNECFCERGFSGACACITDPSSAACICFQNGQRGCDGAINIQPGASWEAIKLPDIRHQLLPKPIAGIVKGASGSGCRPLNLPKKMLFSL